MQGCNLVELWLTHQALTLAFKLLYKLRLNITAHLMSGALKWDERRFLPHQYHSVGGLQR